MTKHPAVGKFALLIRPTDELYHDFASAAAVTGHDSHELILDFMARQVALVKRKQASATRTKTTRPRRRS